MKVILILAVGATAVILSGAVSFDVEPIVRATKMVVEDIEAVID